MESQPARPRPRPIVMAAVIAIVALVVGVAYLATSTTVQPTILQGGAGSNSSSPCGNPFPAEVQRGDWSGSGGAGRQIVTFFLPSNAVGTVCVSYQAPASAQSLLASPNSTVLSGSVLSPNVTYSGGGYIVNSENPADGVTITTTLQYSSNNASGGTMSVVAMYTIESSAAKGIFAFSYPGECPPWIPIAIGYSAATQHRKPSTPPMGSSLTPQVASTTPPQKEFSSEATRLSELAVACKWGMLPPKKPGSEAGGSPGSPVAGASIARRDTCAVSPRCSRRGRTRGCSGSPWP